MSGPQNLGGAGGAATAPRPGAGGPASNATRPASAAVTDWAVAPIPSSAPVAVAPPAVEAADDRSPSPSAPAIVSSAAQPQFPVDDEPAEVEAAGSAPRPPHDGDIDAPAPQDDYPPFDDEPPYDPEYDEPRRQAAAPTVPEAARAAEPAQVPARPSLREVPPRANRPQASDGVERRGEAVIRQVLGAKFLREEPYQPPSRFN